MGQVGHIHFFLKRRPIAAGDARKAALFWKVGRCTSYRAEWHLGAAFVGSRSQGP